MAAIHIQSQLEPQLQLSHTSQGSDQRSRVVDCTYDASPAPQRGLCDFRNISFENVNVTGALKTFSAEGLREKPIIAFSWLNISAQGRMAGTIKYACDWTMKNVRLRTSAGDGLTISGSENVQNPGIVEL